MIGGVNLECRKCPYGEEDFKRIAYLCEEMARERINPNDIYPYLKQDASEEEFEQLLWCDKIGGKVFWDYTCEDAYEQSTISQNHSKQKRKNKRERDQKHKNRLKYLAKNVSKYQSPVIYTDEIWINGQGYIENQKPYYKRLYRGKGRNSDYNYQKKMSNRKIRRYKGELPKKGNLCHKLYCSWWFY